MNTFPEYKLFSPPSLEWRLEAKMNCTNVALMMEPFRNVEMPLEFGQLVGVAEAVYPPWRLYPIDKPEREGGKLWMERGRDDISIKYRAIGFGYHRSYMYISKTLSDSWSLKLQWEAKTGPPSLVEFEYRSFGQEFETFRHRIVYQSSPDIYCRIRVKSIRDVVITPNTTLEDKVKRLGVIQSITEADG